MISISKPASRTILIMAIVVLCFLLRSSDAVIPGEPAYHTYPHFGQFKVYFGRQYYDYVSEVLAEVLYNWTVETIQDMNNDPLRKRWYSVNSYADMSPEGWEAYWTPDGYVNGIYPPLVLSLTDPLTKDDWTRILDLQKRKNDAVKEISQKESDIKQLSEDNNDPIKIMEAKASLDKLRLNLSSIIDQHIQSSIDESTTFEGALNTLTELGQYLDTLDQEERTSFVRSLVRPAVDNYHARKAAKRAAAAARKSGSSQSNQTLNKH